MVWPMRRAIYKTAKGIPATHVDTRARVITVSVISPYVAFLYASEYPLTITESHGNGQSRYGCPWGLSVIISKRSVAPMESARLVSVKECKSKRDSTGRVSTPSYNVLRYRDCSQQSARLVVSKDAFRTLSENYPYLSSTRFTSLGTRISHDIGLGYLRFDRHRILRDKLDNWYDIKLRPIDVSSKIYLRKAELIVSNSNKSVARKLSHCGEPL